MKIGVLALSVFVLSLFSITASAQSGAFLASIDQTELTNAYNLKLTGESTADSYFQSTEPAAASEMDSSNWEFAFTPYLWMAGISGNGVLRGVPIGDIDISFSDIIEDLDMALTGHFEARKNNWTLLFDVFYVNISEKPQTVVVRVKQTVAELGGTYHVSPWFEALAGVRIVKYRLELTPTPLDEPLVEGSKTWADPFVGARARAKVGSAITLIARGDVGGFAIGSDFSWNILLGGAIQVARWGAIDAGYRWWDVDYDTDDENFKVDTLQAGPFIGMTFFF